MPHLDLATAVVLTLNGLASASKSEKINALLNIQVRKEKLRQRSQDEDLDQYVSAAGRC